MNTAPILYLNGNASSLQEGAAQALEILESGKGFDKLKDWVRAQNSGDPGEKLERLEGIAQKA